MPVKFLVGCYTDGIEGESLHLCSFDSINKKLELINSLTIQNPSYIAIGGDKSTVYVVNENHTSEDRITSLSIDTSANSFKILDEVSSGGSDPCYISVDASRKHIFTANYSNGKLCVVPLKDDGRFEQGMRQVIWHKIPDEIPQRENTHLHAAVLSQDEKFLLVSNLGLDTLSVYAYDSSKKHRPLGLSPISVLKFPDYTGPRHLIFSLDFRYVCVVGELDATLNILYWNNGLLKLKHSTPLMDKDYKGANSAADIHFSIDGRFIYVSNRGDANQVIIFSFDQSTGAVNFVSRCATGGTGPRNFAIDPTGEFMFIANQLTHEVRLFKIDKSTGLIKDLNNFLEIKNPVCVKFLPN